jgi:hypothetical protein
MEVIIFEIGSPVFICFMRLLSFMHVLIVPSSVWCLQRQMQSAESIILVTNHGWSDILALRTYWDC